MSLSLIRSRLEVDEYVPSLFDVIVSYQSS